MKKLSCPYIFSCCYVQEAVGGSGGKAPLILNLSCRWM